MLDTGLGFFRYLPKKDCFVAQESLTPGQARGDGETGLLNVLGPATLHQGIDPFFQHADAFIEKHIKPHCEFNKRNRLLMPFHAIARDEFDMLCGLSKRHCAKFARFGVELVGRQHYWHRKAGLHGIMDDLDGLCAIFLEIAENAHKPVAEIGTGARKLRPVNGKIQIVVHTKPWLHKTLEFRGLAQKCKRLVEQFVKSPFSLP
jgi:hypothetical protein